MTQTGTLARLHARNTQKIWAHSGDSHFVEPKGLWQEILPKALADRMPQIEEVEQDGRPMERIRVDGQEFFFPIPKIAQKRADGKKSIAELSVQAAGAKDLSARIADSTRRASGARWSIPPPASGKA
jgi:hypothetical protein